MQQTRPGLDCHCVKGLAVIGYNNSIAAEITTQALTSVDNMAVKSDIQARTATAVRR